MLALSNTDSELDKIEVRQFQALLARQAFDGSIKITRCQDENVRLLAL